MKKYSINIAKAYTMSDWQGEPAHRFLARVELDDRLTEAAAMRELQTLRQVYPFPQYHLTLSADEVVRQSTTVASTAPREFLDKKLWRYPSVDDLAS